MMMKLMTLVFLTLALTLQVSAAVPSGAELSEAIAIIGEYTGYRDSKVHDQLAQYEDRRFELMHQGKVAEAERIMAEHIIPLRSKLAAMPECTLNMWAETRGGKGNFTIQLIINPVSASEERTGGHYTKAVWFDLSIEDYTRFFVGSREVNRVEVGKGNARYQTFVSTKINGRNRKIIVNQQYIEGGKLDEDHHIVFEIEDGELAKITVERKRRPAVAGLSIGRLRTFMKAEITGLNKTTAGLQLGRYGRVSTPRFVLRALQAERDTEYTSIIRDEQAFLNK